MGQRYCNCCTREARRECARCCLPVYGPLCSCSCGGGPYYARPWPEEHFPLEAVSIRQPFAAALLDGATVVINRDYPPHDHYYSGWDPQRERPRRPRWLAIHTGKNMHDFRGWRAAFGGLEEEPDVNGPEDLGFTAGNIGRPADEEAARRVLADHWPNMPDWSSLPRGRLLGLARLTGARFYADAPELDEDPWAAGPWCWFFDVTIRLPRPLRLRGQKGLFGVYGNTRRQLEAAYRGWRARERTAS